MLSDQQINQYREEGYTLAEQVFSPEQMDRLEEAFDTIIANRLRNRAQLNAQWEGDWKKDMGADRVVLATHDVQAYAAAWTAALVHDEFTHVLAQCLGTQNVQLHHTKLFQKPSGKGAGFPMHQDAPYFPHEKHSMMAAVIHVTDADESMGCIRVVPGSHKLGQLPEFNTKAHYLDPKEYPIEDATPVPARRGDVVIFNYLTIHGSGTNDSDRTRKTVLVQVRDAEDQPTENQHLSHAQGMMLRGVNPLSQGQTTVDGTLDSGKAVAAK